MIINAAAGDPNVKALVYVAAFVPDVGEQLGQLPGSQIQSALNAVPYTRCNGSTGTDLYLQPARFHAVFAADLPLSETEVMAVEQRPFSANCFTDVTAAAAGTPSSRGASSPAPTWPSRLPSKVGVPARAHCIEIPAPLTWS